MRGWMSVEAIDIRNQTAVTVHYHIRRSVISTGRSGGMAAEIPWKMKNISHHCKYIRHHYYGLIG